MGEGRSGFDRARAPTPRKASVIIALSTVTASVHGATMMTVAATITQTASSAAKGVTIQASQPPGRRRTPT